MSDLKFKAILSKTTTDKIKASLNNSQLATVSFDLYLNKTSEFSQLVEEYFDEEFTIEISK